MTDLAATGFSSFEVSLVRGEGNIYWLSADCSEGALNAVPVRAPDWGVTLLPDQGPLDWLNTTIRTARGDTEEGARIGQALRDILFGNREVRELFARLRAAASVRKQQVVLRLMGAPADVSDWPWELMHDPAKPDTPLVLSDDVHLVRTARVRTYPSGRHMVEPPINLLVIMSNPLPGGDQAAHQLDQFDLYEEKRHLLRDLEPLIESGKLNITIEDRPTLERLSAVLQRTKRGFHVVHYLGHASEHGLWFEDRNGTGKLVLSDEFGKFLKRSPDLRFVLFAGCETARAPQALTPDDWEGGLSITQRAVRDAAPVVMGMQVVLPFRTQRIFTRSFYASLTAGSTVARALALARARVWDDQKDRVKQLDWAIPTLFLGADDPDAVLDVRVPATPPPRIDPVRVRISPAQKDLRFVARHANLRRVIDVLSNRTTSRLICIRGEKVRPQDLSNLMDRAMEELEPDVAQLTFSVRDLKDEPEVNLLKLLREVLRQYHDGIDKLADADTFVLRSLLVDKIAQIPVAIAIDHAHELPEDSPVVDIIRDILNRRGKARVVLVHTEDHNPFNFGLEGLWEPTIVTEMRWSEVWAWLRGQLPELARLGEQHLHPLHTSLGDHLERWERLADHVAGRYSGPDDPEIAALAKSLMPKDQADTSVDDFFSAPPQRSDADPFRTAQRPSFGSSAPEPQGGKPRPGSAPTPGGGKPAAPRPASPAAPPEAPAEGAPTQPAPARTREAITVAVAGPFTEGRDLAFRDAMARFADVHGLPGRVSAKPDDGAAIVARALNIASPFKDGQSASTAALLTWMSEVAKTDAKVLVLDFGTARQSAALSDFVDGLAGSGILVIAAGGNSGEPIWPAWDAGALAVGAATDGRPASYSVYFPDKAKPDLFAPETLDGTPLEGWVEGRGQRGTTFAALYAAAAATLVWASYPTLQADEVRAILHNTATGQGPRILNVPRALHEVRSLVVKDILQSGDMELYQLVSESGLPMDLATQTVKHMEADGRLERRETEHGDVYSYPARIAAQYDALRRTPPNYRRTMDQEQLIADARDLARRRSLTERDAWGLWRSGQLGNRIIALAHQYKSPGAYTLAIIEEGILKSKSAFEQFHAMRIAQRWGSSFDAADRDRIASAITSEMAGDKFDDERRSLGRFILDQFASI